MKIDVMMRDIRVIPLDKIKLDQENVRFGNDVAQNQREAIKLMLSAPEDAKKLLRLAEHIAEHGLDPTELQLVTPDDDGNFIVLEGNRRLTALKLLQRPDLCPSDRGYKGFLKAHNSLANGVPEGLQCSVVASRVDGDMWIELKHTGENRGVGRVGWDSDIRDERRARTTGIESIGRQVRNLITENQHIFSSKAELDVFEVDVTTLTRIFSSSLGQNTFRLKVENKLLVPQLPLEHIAPSLEFLLDMFVSHGYNVNDVRKHENQVITLGHIPPEILPHKLAEAAKVKPTPSPKPTPEPTKPEVNPTTEATKQGTLDVNGPTPEGTPSEPNGGSNQVIPPNIGEPTEGKGAEQKNGNDGIDTNTPPAQPGVSQAPQVPDGGAAGGMQDGKPQPVPEPQKEPGIRAKPQVRARKFLTPFSLKITNSRINSIYNELRTVLRVDECPNATAITFRVFMETTCDEYIQLQKDAGTPIKRWDTNQELRGGGNGDKLVLKVQSVVKHLEAEKRMPAPAAKAIFKRASSYDQPGSIDHFNLFVHGAHSIPLPSELKDIAEEYRPMLEAIWR
ncbi:hypothetical protein OZ911_27350 [Pseudomonas fortuita]|uniref:Uncharacterized protein n=1 Tax=Pseudomonas fortuita TaxID=3233375 RepID=A0ACD4P6R6_9PSED|nr:MULTISPECIES: hypothetical protein [Pseudomonas]WAP63549.1 hypothetical protein OZ911_27350 [Pseudomonas putida]